MYSIEFEVDQTRNGATYLTFYVVIVNFNTLPPFDEMLNGISWAIRETVSGFISTHSILDENQSYETSGLLVLENMNNNTQHVAEQSLLSNLTSGLLLNCISQLVNSDNELSLWEIRYQWWPSNKRLSIAVPRARIIYHPTFRYAGACCKKIPEYIPKTSSNSPTWTIQYCRQHTQIACAAFAIGWYIQSTGRKNYNTKLYDARDMALEIMNKCNFTSFITIEEILKRFTQHYPKYRLTVLLRASVNARLTTMEGSEFELYKEDGTLNKRYVVYIVYDLQLKHYGTIKTPIQLYKHVRKTNFWCHACVKLSYTRCQCEDVPIARRGRKIICKYCNTINCNGKGCFKNCSFCGSKFKGGYNRKNGEGHRCIVYSPLKEQEFNMDNSENHDLYNLWAYDIESRVKRVDGTCIRFETLNGEFVLEDGLPKVVQVLRSIHEVNMIICRHVFCDVEKIFFGDGALTEFLDFMLTHNGGYNICVAHNGSGYDTRLITEGAARFDIEPNIKLISRGSRYLEMVLSKRTIFRDSLLHLPGSLSNLGKSFGIEIVKGIL